MKYDPPGTLIKSGQSESIRSFGHEQGGRVAPSTSTVAHPERTAMVEMMEKLANCEAQISAHENALAKAYSDGEAAGREAALDDFEEDRKEALAVLSSTLANAMAVLTNSLLRFEGIALEASLAALNSLVEDVASYRTVLLSTIKRQVKTLDKDTILSISVSRLDFPNSEAVAEIARTVGADNANISVSEKLSRGKCEIKVMLGSLEIDLARSWREIEAVLTDHLETNDAATD